MKSQNARMGALSKLMDLLDNGDKEDMSKPFGDAGDKNPAEKSGMGGAVDPAKYFAKGGEVDSGDGDDEGSNDEFASSWEALTGKSFRRPRDSEGLGGESADDGMGVDAASEGDDEEMSDEDKAKLSAAYHKHVLGKR